MRTTERWLEDHVIGETRRFHGRTVTREDIQLHAEQTGDFFPHHLDDAWCAMQPFGRPMAHGTLVLAIAVGMTAEDINPQSLSYGYDRIRFVGPVHIGDTLSVTATVTELADHPRRASHGILHEAVGVTNQHGATVLVLTHLYLVARRAPVVV